MTKIYEGRGLKLRDKRYYAKLIESPTQEIDWRISDVMQVAREKGLDYHEIPVGREDYFLEILECESPELEYLGMVLGAVKGDNGLRVHCKSARFAFPGREDDFQNENSRKRLEEILELFPVKEFFEKVKDLKFQGTEIIGVEEE